MSLSRLWWNFWCVVALVPPTTQSIFDKIMPSTYSSAPTKITSTSLSFSTSTSTTINPTITRLSSSRATPVASRTYTVAVGKGNFQFVPDTIQANVGDTVEFEFFPANHSVVRAEYQHPCVPYEMSGEGKVGFFSGYKPVGAVLDDPPKFSLLINDTLPIFFYCSATGSCINHQMLGVINPNSSVSLDIQKAAAKKSDFMVIPGHGFPTEEGRGSTVEGSSSTNPTTTTFLSPNNVDTPRTTAHLSPGAIASIAVASLLFALILFGVMFLLRRHSRILQTLNHRRPSLFQTNNKISAQGKQLAENKYANTKTSLASHGNGEIGYWTSYAPPSTPNDRSPSTNYKYKSPTDFLSSSSAYSSSRPSPPPPPPVGIDQMHELPTSEPKVRGGFNVDWSAYDESLSPSAASLRQSNPFERERFYLKQLRTAGKEKGDI